MGEQARRTVLHGPDPQAGQVHRATGGLSDARKGDTAPAAPSDQLRPRPDLDGAEPGALGPLADERETERLAPANGEDGASLPAESSDG